MEIYIENIRAELEAIRTDANTRLDALNELERHGSKFKAADLQILKDSISTDPNWKGNPRPMPQQKPEEMNDGK